METERHKNYKDQLFNHLHDQIYGCMGCHSFSSASRRDHIPSLERPRAPMQKIIWLCEDGHHHTLDIFAKAAWCEQERQFTAPSGLRCKPDITIYDAHRQPCVFIEIKHKNARNNTRSVAREIGTIWLQLGAPPPGSFQKELTSSRPWWELTDMPDGSKREMETLTRLGDKLFGPRTGTWANLDSILNDDGSLAATTMQHSEPEMNGDEFPTVGGYIWVNECSLSCEEAQQANAIEEKWYRIDARRRELWEVQRRLGSEVFDALRKAERRPFEFTVPIGQMEIHTKVALTDLTQFDRKRPAVIDVQGFVDEATAEIERLEAELDGLTEQRYPTMRNGADAQQPTSL